MKIYRNEQGDIVLSGPEFKELDIDKVAKSVIPLVVIGKEEGYILDMDDIIGK